MPYQTILSKLSFELHRLQDRSVGLKDKIAFGGYSGEHTAIFNEVKRDLQLLMEDVHGLGEKVREIRQKRPDPTRRFSPEMDAQLMMFMTERRQLELRYRYIEDRYVMLNVQ